MATKNPLMYYINKVPHDTELSDDDPFDVCIEAYRKWKKAIADYYTPDKELEKEYPEMYERLRETEITEEEIIMLTREYYKTKVIFYSNELSADDYDLE